jgi:hypothetical protein
MFAAFEMLKDQPEFETACDELKRRLRRDTDVILHLKKRMLAELFEDKSLKIAFQNRLLIFLLYKCGGFVPTCDAVEDIARIHGIPIDHVINRHGTKRDENLTQVLSGKLSEEVRAHFADGSFRPQNENIYWPGGYFGFPGSLEAAKSLQDDVRQDWRKEYLPGPTALAALSLCTAIAGLLLKHHSSESRLRVTLHRTRTVGDEALLQQCCEYVGTSIPETKPAAARTFPAEKATIGLAYSCRQIVRSTKGVSPEALRIGMEALNLNFASREMSSSVGFVMAMPIVQSEIVGGFSGPNPVAGVLYIDSEQPGYFIGDERAKDLAAMVELFVHDASDFGLLEFRRIRNLSVGRRQLTVPSKGTPPSGVSGLLEIVTTVEPPRTAKEFQLNFDYVDFGPA